MIWARLYGIILAFFDIPVGPVGRPWLPRRKAEWGDSLDGLTPGVKFRADGTKTHIGVIKQKGSKGFYRLTVSEQ